MSSYITDSLAKTWLEVLTGKPYAMMYASLHFETPDPADPAASEVSGGSYSRSIVTFDLVDPRSINNVQQLQWLNLEQVTIVAVGVWTEPTKGEMLLWTLLDEPVPVPDRGSYQVDAKDFFVRL